jgi:hypothetical protein
MVKAILVVGSLLFTFGLLELVGHVQIQLEKRNLVATKNSSYYYREIVRDRYPQLLRDSLSEPCKGHYRDYYVLSVDCKSSTINTTDYYSSRAVPSSAPIGSPSPVVWIFGGSTMLELSAPDELTIANWLGKALTTRFGKVTIVNFGMGGFASTQEKVKFIDLLSRVPVTERPKLVVFYDGYNDPGQSYTFGPGNMQEDLNGKLKLIVEGRTGPLAKLFLSRGIQDYSAFWRQNIAPRVEAAFLQEMITHRSPTPVDPSPAVEMYLHNAQVIKAVAEQFNIQPLFLLQPMIFTKQPLSKGEEDVMRDVVLPNKGHLDYMIGWYDSTRRKIAGLREFVDLSTSLNGRSDLDFFDHGHIAPYTSEAIGTAIGQVVAERYSHVFQVPSTVTE